MEVSLYDKPEFSKLFKAFYNEKKLSKALINSTDISSVATDFVEISQNISLRQSGQMLIGLLKILLHKSLLVLNELEEFLQSFTLTPKKAQKYTKNIKTTQLITLNPKKALLAIEDAISVGSYGASTRGSIEIGRNIADVNAITLEDVNITPRSIKPIEELDDAASIMQEDSPKLEYQDVDLIQIETPKMSTRRQTPAKKIQMMKNRVRVDKKTLMKKNDAEETLIKEHLKIGVDHVGLSAFELFNQSLIFLPTQIQEKLKEVKLETFEFGQEGSPPRTNEEFIDVEMNFGPNLQSPHSLENQENAEVGNIQKANINAEEDERRLIERSRQLLISLGKKKGKVKFSTIHSNERLDASQKFYDLMMLASRQNISLDQKGFFGEIFIKFNKV